MKVLRYIATAVTTIVLMTILLFLFRLLTPRLTLFIVSFVGEDADVTLWGLFGLKKWYVTFLLIVSFFLNVFLFCVVSYNVGKLISYISLKNKISAIVITAIPLLIVLLWVFIKIKGGIIFGNSFYVIEFSVLEIISCAIVFGVMAIPIWESVEDRIAEDFRRNEMIEIRNKIKEAQDNFEDETDWVEIFGGQSRNVNIDLDEKVAEFERKLAKALRKGNSKKAAKYQVLLRATKREIEDREGRFI